MTKDLFDMPDQRAPQTPRYPDVPGHAKHSDTSYKAARSMDEAAPNIRERIFEAIELSGNRGITADEIEQKLLMRTPTVTARVRELSLAGRIEDSGRRRDTRSGRQARVYVAKRETI